MVVSRNVRFLTGLVLVLPALWAPLAYAEPAAKDQVALVLPARPVAPAGGDVIATGCADACRQRHNQCRIAKRGAPSCDAELQRCLQGCLAGRRR